MFICIPIQRAPLTNLIWVLFLHFLPSIKCLTIHTYTHTHTFFLKIIVCVLHRERLLLYIFTVLSLFVTALYFLLIECDHVFLRFHCICPPGYFGTLCDLDVNECEVSPCLHEGICINTPGGFKCVCRPGYSGSSPALRWHEDQYESLKSLPWLLRPHATEAPLDTDLA